MYYIFSRLEELESLLERVDHNSKCQIEELTAKLHNKSSEVSGLSLENERLKVWQFFSDSTFHTSRKQTAFVGVNNCVFNKLLLKLDVCQALVVCRSQNNLAKNN